jgi:calcineurin-like phosphoesterase family protein
MSTWLTGDLHFYHENIIHYCRRPFSDVREMNGVIASHWARLVAKDDTIYVLGDFAFTKDREYEVAELFNSLPGRKILLKGNHDKTFVLELKWEAVVWNPLFLEGAWLCHDGEDMGRTVRDPAVEPVFQSHVHDVWKMRGHRLNMGVDVWHFRPVSLLDALDYWTHRWDYYVAHGKDA